MEGKKEQCDKETEEGEDPQQPTQTQPVCCLTYSISYEWKEIVFWKKKIYLKSMSNNNRIKPASESRTTASGTQCRCKEKRKRDRKVKMTTREVYYISL